MSPVWETFANASVRGYRSTIKGVTYWLSLVVMPSRGSSTRAVGGATGNSTDAYFSFRHSTQNVIHRFKQDGTFKESTNVASSQNIGNIATSDVNMIAGIGGSVDVMWTPSNYPNTNTPRQFSGQGVRVSIDSSNNMYGMAMGAGYVSKYDSNKNLVWCKDPNFSTSGWFDADLAGNFYVTSTGANPIVGKFDPTGVTNLWSKVTNSYSSATLGAFAADKSNGGAYHSSTVGGTPSITKYDTNGNVAWARNANLGYPVAISTFGNAIYWVIQNSNDVYVVKLDSSGNVEWQRGFTGAYLLANNGYYLLYGADADAIYLGFTQQSSSGMYEWQHCFKYPASGAVTGSYSLGYTLTIAASSISISSFSPSTGNASIVTPSNTSQDTSTSVSFSTTSTTQTIIKVP